MVLDNGMVLGSAVDISGNTNGLVLTPDIYDMGAAGQSLSQLALHLRCTTAMVQNGSHGGVEIAMWMAFASAASSMANPVVVGVSRPFGNLLLDTRSLPAVGDQIVVPLYAPHTINNQVLGLRYIRAVWVNTHVAQNPGTSANYFTAGAFDVRLVDADTLAKNRNYPRAF